MIDKTEQQIMSTWETIPEIPLVTIRSLTYNHADYIETALDSFLSQITPFRFQVLVHDDASTDGTTEILRSYAEKYPNIIRPIIQPKNLFSQGNGLVRRAIDARLEGKYIAMCECDDYWTDPHKLARQVAYLEAHPECTMVCHPVNYVCDGEIIKNDRITDQETDLSAESIIEGGGLYLSTPSICCRTDVFLDYPAWRDFAVVGDYPLQILAAIRGTVHYMPESMAAYRYQAPGSWTQQQKNSKARAKRQQNEIEWLEMLDRDTDGRYTNSIRLRNGFFALLLYKAGAWSYRQAAEYISAMAPGGKKLHYSLALRKSAVKQKLTQRGKRTL